MHRARPDCKRSVHRHPMITNYNVQANTRVHGFLGQRSYTSTFKLETTHKWTNGTKLITIWLLSQYRYVSCICDWCWNSPLQTLLITFSYTFCYECKCSLVLLCLNHNEYFPYITGTQQIWVMEKSWSLSEWELSVSPFPIGFSFLPWKVLR